MKSGLSIVTLAVAASLGAAPSADAKGCIKGAVAGGVAGHYAGHHGVLGAVGGCVVGRHLASRKAAREREERLRQQQNPAAYDGSGSRDPGYRQVPSDPRYNGAAAPAVRDDGSGSEPLYTGGAYRR